MIDAALEARLVSGLRSARRAVRDEALAELHAQLGGRLHQVCLRIACDAEDADDALQETYLDVVDGIGDFRGEARFTTWIVRIAMRRASRLRHRRNRRAEEELDAGLEARERAASPQAQAADLDDVRRLLAKIACLSMEQRSVLALAAGDGMSHAQIAEVLGIPEGTVASRLHAARAALRAALGSATQDG